MTRSDTPTSPNWEAVLEHVAGLARLYVSPAEKTAMAGQFARILAYVNQMRALDTAGVPPTMGLEPQAPAMRDDEPRPCLSRDEVLANAPDAVGPVFRVPRVIE